MIERSVNLTQFQPVHSVEYIWSTKYNKIDLRQSLAQLYNSTSQQNRSIFGMQLYEQQQRQQQIQGSNNNNDKSSNGELIKCQLDSKHKNYLSWCYLLLNWQRVSAQNIEIFHKCLPSTEHAVQQIRVQSNLLKFTKNDHALVLNLNTYSTSIEGDIRCLDAYDRTGANSMLQYKLSLSKIWIYSIGYSFDGLVTNVESCEGFAAVTTKTAIYVISLKQANGNSTRFAVKDCIDMKWNKRGLYYLQKSGHLGLLQRQMTYLPTLNKFTNLTIISQSQPANQLSNQYKPQRIALTGISELSTALILLSVSDKNRKKIVLEMVYSAKHGLMRGAKLRFELREVSGNIMYSNLVTVKNQLTLITVSGFDDKIQCYHQHKFGTI